MTKPTAKEIFTIPNLMSYFRILLIPVFCAVYLTASNTKDYYIAAGILLVSSLTDLFDGRIARRFHMVTELGKALDPIADKLTHAALAVCLAVRYPLMRALLVLMAVKEGYMGIMGLVNALIILTMVVMAVTLLCYIPVFRKMNREGQLEKSRG